jgi:hypothetical protein
MKLSERVFSIAPLVVALVMSCAAANAQTLLSAPPVNVVTPTSVATSLARDKAFEQMVETCYPAPDPWTLYGTPGRKLGTPFATPRDNYYSGAISRPCDLDHWYGNGYNW